MLSQDLIKFVNVARQALILNENGDLNLGYRQTIWFLFGPYTPSQIETRQPQENKGIGLKRRAYLAILAARYVLPIWYQAYPHDDTIIQILELAEQTLNLKTDQKAAISFMRPFMSLEALYALVGDYDREYAFALQVRTSAAKALSTALFDEVFDPDLINLSMTDDDLGFMQCDASYHAANAFSNGAFNHNDDFDKAKRREFWEWWLDTAVPQAYDLLTSE